MHFMICNLRLYQHKFDCLTRKLMTRNSSSRILNVAEKNDAAKRISHLLSDQKYTWRDGFSNYNKIYEFTYHILGQNNQMIMTSVSGHLTDFEFSESYRKWNFCQPIDLFDANVLNEVKENKVDIKRTLEKEILSCQTLIIWTDCDREGENIGFQIIDVCKNINPNIEVYRAKFSEITERSIRSACQNLARPDSRVSDAVDVRKELDLRIGSAFTCFQTLRLQKVFPEVLSNKVVSYGSCQFPTLGFVVEKYKAREQFQSEKLWEIEVSHDVNKETDNRLTTLFTWKRNRIVNEMACHVLYDKCRKPQSVATVTDVKSRPRSRGRPVPLETVELVKLASRKLRINAKETMRIAEKLYTKGLISYPRTETNTFSKDINLQKLVEEQSGHPVWGRFAQDLLALDGGPCPRKGFKSDKAHPPIHPTKLSTSLSGDEDRLYELIVRHFLACCHRVAQGHETTVEIELGGETFSAEGLKICAKNYLDIYKYDHWKAKIIPVYHVGEKFEPSDVEIVSQITAAPPLLTEADLIELMDKHRIGTDATHADLIEILKQRNYVKLTSDERFLPSPLGMGLVEGYNYEMSQPVLRAELESDLKKICEGKAEKNEVLRRHIAKYKRVYKEAVANANKLDEALGKRFGESAPVENNDV